MIINFKKLLQSSHKYDEEFVEAYIQADKLMIILMFIQWMVAIFITSIPYDTYIYGFISGGIVFGGMYITFKYFKGTQTMMLFSGIAMMVFSLIFIQQLNGRIEMHFHIFISMAVLTVYKSFLPIIAAAITTTLHHFIYNYLQTNDISIFDVPFIIFNYGCGLDIVFLHAIFVVIEAVVLIHIVNIQVKRTLALTDTQRKLNALNLELEHSSGHDTLTGLPNRKNLSNQMDYIIASAHRHRTKFAVIFLDLDYFKNINDTLGHNIGDQLLQKVSKTFKEILRENDIVSRIGGDEFIIVIVDVTDESNVVLALEKIIHIFKEDIIVGKHNLRLSASIGVSIYPDDSENFEELMKYADLAMYKAKDLGRDNFKFFTNNLDNELHNEVSLIKDMQTALFNNEFKLYYQPKVDTLTGEIIAAEALIRWEHPTKGLIPPGIFIGLAENTGFILKLGTFVIDEASRYISRLSKLGYSRINISINVSARQFQHSGLYEELHNAINKHIISPSQLSIEVTESVMMENIQTTIDKLHMIKKLGIKIHMDDFGTGYSSLSYLQQLPIDTLKIDKSFVDEIAKDSKNDQLILNTILSMGQTLNLDVIAEGIEHKYQLDYISAKKCNSYQGYYFSKPIKEDAFIELLKK